MKFIENIMTDFNLQCRQEIVLQISKEITQKVQMQELWFLHSAHRLMLIDICKKLHENSLSGFQVIVLSR